MAPLLVRRFHLLAATAIVLMAVLQFTSIVQESQTFDEAVHLTSGYRYWRTGRFTMNWEHPPLQKLLSALPLLIPQPPLPSDPKLLIDQYEYARTFLYKGPQNADTLLLLGRSATILLTACLGIALAWFARRHFGEPAALLAIWMFALDPNLIAHGRYVTTDLAAGLFYFLTVALWVNYLCDTSPRKAVLTGASLGLALASKFSLVLLIPLLPALLAIRWLLAWRDWRSAVRRAAASLATIMVVASLVVGLVYAPETWRMIRGRNHDVDRVTIAGITPPPHSYFRGLEIVLKHNAEGHPAYLLGEMSEKGWWYYFPVAFGVKSPTALLLLTALALVPGVLRLPLLFCKERALGFVPLALAIPPAVFFGLSITSHINIGLRHLLPVYPFLYVLGAAAVARILPRRPAVIVAAALLLVQAGETASIHPNYLTFFNTLAGGPKAGPLYLLDSNLDWGQDLKKLKVYMDRRQLPSICLFYFGYATPSYYGIKEEYLPKTWDKDELGRMDCIGAISVTLLHDLYIKKGSYEWLRQRRPIGTVGNSIYLYDLRKPR